ncbi:hypothetical protein FACS189487_04970 [Campylobacterota bacterium]|nr:hypothetical protein FACS189487_04970 [Campylobacterota bacterium]
MALQHERSSLIAALPLLKEYRTKFETANKRLSRTTLTGKISSLHNAATLFEFMESTQRDFAELQGQLVDYLLEENLKKSGREARSQAAGAIDILTRSLYERSADVGFLATDSEIVEFMKIASPTMDERIAIEKRLKSYAENYTIYEEIALVRLDGRVAARLTGIRECENLHSRTVSEAVESDTFLQAYKKSEITKKRSLYFSNKIVSGAEAVGVLIMYIKTEDEMKKISSAQGCRLQFVDEKGAIIASSDPFLPTTNVLKSDGAIVQIGKNFFLTTIESSKGFGGYFPPNWKTISYAPLGAAAASAAKSESTKSDGAKGEGAKSESAKGEAEKNIVVSLPQSMREILSKSEEISEDLSDVVINGELIASKTKAYALNPILQNIREIGDDLQGVFARSERDLISTFSASLFNTTKQLANLAQNVLARNLYERSCDCRWWTYEPLFYGDDAALITAKLEYLNSLYTVYSLIYIYDENRSIRAVSKRSAAHFVGQKTSDSTSELVLANSDRTRYFISPFAHNHFYGDKPTYTYHGSLVSKNGKNAGGIALVFDCEQQLDAILNMALPHGEDGGVVSGAFSLFIDGHSVIASTNSEILPLDPAPLDALALDEGDGTRLAEYNGKKYVVALCSVDGYREYKHPTQIKAAVFSPA